MADSTMNSAKLTADLEFRPALSWFARATKVVDLVPGQSVGYVQGFV